jgi:hypothetical protein
MSKGIPYLQLHKCFKNNIKIRRLARRLDCSRPTARGYIVTLWLEVLEYKPDGVIDDWSNEEIAEYAEYEDDADEFIEALLKVQLLKPFQGVYRISGWQKYSGTLEVAKRRSYEREKKRAQRDAAKRDCPGDIIGTSRGHNRDVPGTGKNVPKNTPGKHPKKGVKKGVNEKNSARPDAAKSKCPHNVPIRTEQNNIYNYVDLSISCNSDMDTEKKSIDVVVDDFTSRGFSVQFGTQIGRLSDLLPISAQEYADGIKQLTAQCNKPNLKYFLDIIETGRRPGRTQWVDNSAQAMADRTIENTREILRELGFNGDGNTNETGGDRGSYGGVIDIPAGRVIEGKADPAGTGSRGFKSNSNEKRDSMVKKAFQA